MAKKTEGSITDGITRPWPLCTERPVCGNMKFQFSNPSIFPLLFNVDRSINMQNHMSTCIIWKNTVNLYNYSYVYVCVRESEGRLYNGYSDLAFECPAFVKKNTLGHFTYKIAGYLWRKFDILTTQFVSNVFSAMLLLTNCISLATDKPVIGIICLKNEKFLKEYIHDSSLKKQAFSLFPLSHVIFWHIVKAGSISTTCCWKCWRYWIIYSISTLSKIVLGSLTHLGIPYGYFMVIELPAA